MQTRSNTRRSYVDYFRTLQATNKIDGSEKGEKFYNNQHSWYVAELIKWIETKYQFKMR